MSLAKDLEQQAFLRNRLVKRDRHLSKLFKRSGTDCYRVYDRDIPEIPLVVERYGNFALMALFERPYEKSDEAEAAWLDLMKSASAEALGISLEAIRVKTRRRLGLEDQYEKATVGEAEKQVVCENGLRFFVNLDEYLDTGLFMDHRPLRQLLRQQASGKTVLNLFCYTGSFSVYALAGGASAVCAVDLSNTYLAWAADNIVLNDLPLASYQGVRADVLEYLTSAVAARRSWDIIILDPPTFSNSKKMISFLDTNRHWPRLVELCGQLLSPGGVLYFSTNSRDLRFDATLVSGLTCADISAASIPEDFRPTAHKAWKLSRS